MILIRLALQSIANRKLTTALTVLSIALSVALLIGVENLYGAGPGTAFAAP